MDSKSKKDNIITRKAHKEIMIDTSRPFFLLKFDVHKKGILLAITVTGDRIRVNRYLSYFVY